MDAQTLMRLLYYLHCLIGTQADKSPVIGPEISEVRTRLISVAIWAQGGKHLLLPPALRRKRRGISACPGTRCEGIRALKTIEKSSLHF